MREHMGLFRGKRLCNGKWMTGDLLRHPDGTCFICHTGYRLNKYKVDPDTVGECTGLKDKKGKLIFEGDILRIALKGNGMGDYYFPPIEHPEKVVVRWDMCAWMWETLCEDKRYIGFPSAWCHYEGEIIGNAIDNPELLKGGEGNG